MCDRPADVMGVLRRFEPVFSPRVWGCAKVLVVGALLAAGERAAAAVSHP